MKKIGFTLIEIVVVIIIIGILATLATTQYGVMREKALDKEAITSLKLIRAAEKIYRIENNGYYASTSPHIDNINTNLRLDLPTGLERKWDYQTWANNAAIPQTCCAQATRTSFAGGNGRSWSIRHDEEDPVAGTCP